MCEICLLSTSIKELTRSLQQGAKLLNDMFIKRKTVSVKYDDAVETLEGDENRLKHLISYGMIVRSGDTLELDDAYLRFFEEVLAVNEDINVASVQTYISKLKLGINSFLAAETPARRAQYIREIRHTFKSIEQATKRNVVDLKRNVEQTYSRSPISESKNSVCETSTSFISPTPTLTSSTKCAAKTEISSW